MRSPARLHRSSRPIRRPGEIEVLTAVVRGQGNKQIARALHISEATVKTDLLDIYAKLGVPDSSAAVTTALARSMIRLV